MPAVINAVAPWEGELVWVGEPNEGTTNTGKAWKSVEFTLKYQDSQMAEKYITFSAFGDGKVNVLLGLELGTYLRVLWWPESNQGKNGRYHSKNNVITLSAIEPPVKSADTKIKAPNFPEQKKPEAWKNPMPTPDYSEDLPADDGLPF